MLPDHPPRRRPRVATVDPGLPTVVLVGRPNVGKSSLFNRLVGGRRAIVDDAPGVTRDTIIARGEHGGRAFRCVDTGGLLADPPADRAGTTAMVRAQTLRAVAQADVVVCVFDATAGCSPADRDLARLLARGGPPTLWVANKIDTAAREGLLYDFCAIGAGEILPVSAAHGRGLAALADAIVAALPPVTAAAANADGAVRVALVGRPNVGKSSLLNHLLGAERAIVTADAGTTRDAIDTLVEVDGARYVLIDTAGIRRRTRITDPLERHGAVRALGVLERTDVAVVVLDAAEGVTDQDARIIGEAWDGGRGVVLAANKWDARPREARDAGAFRTSLARARPLLAPLPVLCVSARTGEGIDRLFPLVRSVADAFTRVLPTPALNRELAHATGVTPPPSPGGRPLRFYYATQTGRRPPEVTLFTNSGAAVPAAYARYLAQRLRTAFDLTGVPLRLRFRARRPPRASASPGRGSAPRTRRTRSPARGGGRPRPR